MKGIVKRLVAEKGYGFINAERKDYFFHRDDFNGDWSDLVKAVQAGAEITVEFEPKRTDKGLRAEDITEVL